MEITRTIGALLGRRGTVSPTHATEHRWNQLLGIELELENVSLSTGGGIYSSEDFDYREHFSGDRDEWHNMDGDEQQDYIDDWYRNNASGTPVGWTLHSDASLRNGIEFVTSPAMGGQDLANAIDTFYAKKYNYDGGPRTSTHIHVDMNGVQPSVLQSIIILMYAVEDALFNIVDEGRKWAGYSMALSEMSPARLRNVLNPPTENLFVRAINVGQNRERYYGLNFNIARHGTVEFRYFPGAPSKEELISWVDLVVAVKNLAIKYSPQALAAIATSSTAFASFLISNLPYWGQRFVASSGPDNLFSRFEEVIAIATDDSNPERPCSVIMIEDTFYAVLVEKMLSNSKTAKAYLDGSGILNTVRSFDDVSYYMSNARNMVANSDRANNPYVFDSFEDSLPEPEEVPAPQYVRRNAPSLTNLYRQAGLPSAPAAGPIPPIDTTWLRNYVTYNPSDYNEMDQLFTSGNTPTSTGSF